MVDNTRVDITSRRHFPVIVFSSILLITFVLLLGLFLQAMYTHKNTKQIQERNFYLQRLAGIIVHLDEVLTMSARMAAETGNLKWEKRYLVFGPELEAAIKEAKRLLPETFLSETAAQADASNIELVVMEKRAFELIHHGQREAADALLSGEEYKEQKRIYAEGMKLITATIQESVKGCLNAYNRHALLTVIIISIILSCLFFAWIYVLQLMNKYNKRRTVAEEELKVLNESLEQRVTYRTKKLRENEEKFRKLTSSAYDAIIMMDEDGKVSFWNEAAERVFGYSKEEIMGKDLHKLIVPERYYAEYLKGMEGFVKYGTGLIINKRLTLPGLRKDGIEFFAEHSFSSVMLKGKWQAIAIIRDITEREKAGKQINASLKEKEILLGEVHHRVKNNLQIISSLLDMSMVRTRNQEAIDLLTDACNRINSISIVHSQLYKSERFDRIDMNKNIQELSEYLLQIFAGKSEITLDIKADDVYLSVTQAVPCALVLNELISNIFKHAYGKGEKGTANISMQYLNDGKVLIRVKDSGVGIPKDIDIYRTNSQGLKLVRNIVQKQLRGKIQVKRENGTEFGIEFDYDKKDRRGI